MSIAFQHDASFARKLDAEDPLAEFRERFHVPKGPDGKEVIYLCGNSLGLQPRSVRPLVEQELKDWESLAVGGHFQAKTPWYSYHEIFRESGANLVGAHPGEVVMMNSLTVNLHLMMVTFYRPTRERHKILMEDCAFPSDTYAVKSQIRHHGFDPKKTLLIAKPRAGESILRTKDLEALLEEKGKEIALVMLGGVNYFTGQAFEIARIAAAAKRQGCAVGLDLAHAAGNVLLDLHRWDVDFAVWCSYKYLNAGPGAVAGCFVHETHGANLDLPRFAGWWGNDPETRFRMHLQPEFIPRKGAEGWQVSNPPILSLAPLKASLDLFEEAGMEALRQKSEILTGYLIYLIDRIPRGKLQIITPREPAQRGCQVSIRAGEHAQELSRALEAAGVMADFREPDVLRVAPVPLYNTFHEVWRFARILAGEDHSHPDRK